MSSPSHQPDVDATSPQSSLIQAIEKHWQPSKQPLMELTPYSPRPLAVSDQSITITQNARSQSSPRKVWNFKRGWYSFVRGLDLVFSSILGVFVCILCGIGIVTLACIFLSFTFAFAAANGAIWMLVGNGILRVAHLPGYTTDSVAASVGAVGAIFAAMIIAATFSCLPGSNDEEPPWYIRIAATVLSGTLAGVVGFKILEKRIDMKGLDLLHATRAGALGGTIMGPGAMILMPVVVAIILSPLLLVLMAGGEWFYAKSTESWGPNSHSYCYCFCYGSCGDPEIEEEVQRIRDIEHRHKFATSAFDNPYDYSAINRY
ncbi:hypothetical protein EST38_g9091 [Candolleomyces aberdarensis]|uniref:Uncharacterized protein n=1 Tax=Candolleomyces aberdarensis TaxID=2316362 RepID=A0A4Q2DD06_9AGAR|nr:hypothetical protein EST38_g9091 [Candolleomyces aberdarensis]